MDGSDGGLATWMYLTPLNYTLKNGCEGKFMFYVDSTVLIEEKY